MKEKTGYVVFAIFAGLSFIGLGWTVWSLSNITTEADISAQPAEESYIPVSGQVVIARGGSTTKAARHDRSFTLREYTNDPLHATVDVTETSTGQELGTVEFHSDTEVHEVGGYLIKILNTTESSVQLAVSPQDDN